MKIKNFVECLKDIYKNRFTAIFFTLYSLFTFVGILYIIAAASTSSFQLQHFLLIALLVLSYIAIFSTYCDSKKNKRAKLKKLIKEEEEKAKTIEKYANISSIVDKCAKEIVAVFPADKSNSIGLSFSSSKDYLLSYDSYLKSLQNLMQEEVSEDEIDIFAKAACLFYSLLYKHVINISSSVSGINDGVQLFVSPHYYEATLNAELAFNCSLELISCKTSALEKGISQKIWFNNKDSEKLLEFLKEYGGIVIGELAHFEILEAFYNEISNPKSTDILTLAVLFNLIYLHCQDQESEF